MERIMPTSPAFMQYQNMQNNYYTQEKKKEEQQNEDLDTFEHTTYSPYQMYNSKGTLYNNCIARRIVSGNY